MGNQKKYALGIDLGGTKTLVAVVDITTGEVIASERKRTHAEKGQEYMSQHITHLSAAACLGAQAAGLLGAQPLATVAAGLV
jgi:glucokinase